MTNPVNSAFTVTVAIQGTYYDVEITPQWDGKPRSWSQEHIDQWKRAEKLFSKKIVEMTEWTDPEYSLATHGLITGASEAGFSVLNSPDLIQHKTNDVWEQFIECLRDPVTQSQIAGLDPVDEDDEVVGTKLGARVKHTPNDYLNLGAEEQSEVRLSLFRKKCYEHFARANDVPIPVKVRAYKPSEEACLAYHLYRNPSSREEHASGKEANLIWQMQSKEEQRLMAPHVKRIREEMEQVALERQRAAEADSDVELSPLLLSDADEV
ncbi:MAG TPA: hypothetical protein VIJ14_04640 [Rhabdochlamydiaceae bacterium]